jgi:ABC-type multidrug transport system ATPase subunit
LNTLNYRVNGQLDVKGEITINGVRANPNKMSMLSAYIQQDELFFGTLTVQEHLEFHVK